MPAIGQHRFHYLSWPAIVVEQLYHIAHQENRAAINTAYMLIRWALTMGREEIAGSDKDKNEGYNTEPRRFGSVSEAITEAVNGMLRNEVGDVVIDRCLEKLERKFKEKTVGFYEWDHNKAIVGGTLWKDLIKQYLDIKNLLMDVLMVRV
ncbi:hypothetical protein JCM3770_004229 [Rhodotorula araucariae]